MFSKNKPKITIITATLNSEKYLEQTILSVINQTYDNFEYIIIDGQSKDRTLEIVEKYTYRINKIISEPDKGIYDAFNKGIKFATGDIIYFLNSDDYLYSNDIIEKVITVFDNNPTKTIVYGNVLSIDGDFQYVNGMSLTLNDFRNGSMAPHQGVFVKKDLFDKYGYFDVNYTIVADFDFLIKCFKDKEPQAIYFNEIIATFRLSGQGSDFNNLGLFNEMKKKVIEKHFGKSEYSNGIEIQGLYRKWLESLLLKKMGITRKLNDYGIQKVAIFGTMKTAMYLLTDLQNEEFKVTTFLDNNINMQGEFLHGISIKSPKWLLEENCKVDAVILSIESNRDVEIKKELEKLVANNDKKVYIFNWKELATND